MLIETNKYNSMLDSFSCDFELAEEGDVGKLPQLQKALSQPQNAIHDDINLLTELAFLLRYGRAHILIDEETTK